MARSNATRDDSVTGEAESELLQLASAIVSGQVRATVKDIRRFLQCSQDKAMRLRRQVLDVTGNADRGASVPGGRSGAASYRPRLVHSVNGQSRAA
jgi:hypothetical protein